MLTKQSAIKWPSVPDVYNWLMLDGRGNWLIKKEKIFHKGLINFINAHYKVDDNGRWHFQNGPQRVFVTLEYTPYVLRVDFDNSLTHFKTQTDQVIEAVDKLWIDNLGRLLVSWGSNIGLVSDRDLPLLIDKLHYDNDPVEQMNTVDFGFIKYQAQSGNRTPLTLILNQTAHSVFFINEHQVRKMFDFDPNPHPPQGTHDC